MAGPIEREQTIQEVVAFLGHIARREETSGQRVTGILPLIDAIKRRFLPPAPAPAGIEPTEAEIDAGLEAWRTYWDGTHGATMEGAMMAAIRAAYALRASPAQEAEVEEARQVISPFAGIGGTLGISGDVHDEYVALIFRNQTAPSDVSHFVRARAWLAKHPAPKEA